MNLLEWYVPWTWHTDQVANIISIFGALITLFALLFAFRQAREAKQQGHENKEDIKKLTTIADELKESNKHIVAQNAILSKQYQLQNEANQLQRKVMRNQVRPDIRSGGATTQGTDGTLSVRIENNANQAVITKIEYKEDYVTFTKKNTPILFKPGTRIRFDGVSNGKKHITHSAWSIMIEYEDAFQNKYLLSAIGTGGDFKTGIAETDTFEISEEHDEKS